MHLLAIALAAIVVSCALGVVLSRHPFQSAMFLLLGLVGLAGLFVAQDAEFVAAIQVLVYGGGIMVLYIYVLMLTDARAILLQPQSHTQKWFGALVALGLFAVIGHVLYRENPAEHAARLGMNFRAPAPVVASADGAGVPEAAAHTPAWVREDAELTAKNYDPVKRTAWRLFRDYVFPFEVVSILLLVSAVGAVFLARKET